MEDVRDICPQLILFELILSSLALYDADKKAHEEAIRNGGVSLFLNIRHFVTHCFIPAHPLLVRYPRPKDWHEPRFVHLAKP